MCALVPSTTLRPLNKAQQRFLTTGPKPSVVQFLQGFFIRYGKLIGVLGLQLNKAVHAICVVDLIAFIQLVVIPFASRPIKGMHNVEINSQRLTLNLWPWVVALLQGHGSHRLAGKSVLLCILPMWRWRQVGQI